MKAITTLLLMAAAAGAVRAADTVAPVGVDSISYSRQGDYMVLDMLLDLTPTRMKSARAEVITPMIVSAQGDTLPLASVGVYGRGRYLQYLRNGEHPLGAENENIIRSSGRPSDFRYHSDTPWQQWMSDSRLVIRRRLYGCASCMNAERFDPVTSYFELNKAIPEIVYFQAKEEGPKMETLEGSAFVDFPVDQTVIYPEYRNNVRELGRIQATIDTVLNDPDVTITGVWLKGFASPESPYSHNTDLARGRTAALKRHIGQLYHFRDNIISTDYEPEDWAGLRRAVEKSNIDHRDAILALIDSDMEPDAKEARIKKLYPAQYRFMLQNYYPALRHTDYRITCEVKRFDDLNKIREVMRTRPSRLSLREFNLLGNSCRPGSEEFNEVYETAAMMYPDNATANINAANAALQRQDYVAAERYLSRAGDSQQAVYARGSLAFLQGDYDKAEALMRQASDIPEAQNTLDEIKRIRAHKTETVTKVTLP